MRVATAAILLPGLIAAVCAGTVRFRDGLLETKLIDSAEYVDLTEALQALGGRHWQVDDRFLAIVPSGPDLPAGECVFLADAESALIRDHWVRLAWPPRARDGRLWVPASCLPLLAADTTRGVVRSLVTTQAADTLTITFVLGPDDSLPVSAKQLSSLECRVTMPARPDTGFFNRLKLVSSPPSSLVKTVTLDTLGSTVMSFAFRQPTAFLLSSGKSAVRLKLWPKPVHHITRVLIDPGHGGKDPGAVSKRGTREKRVVLDIAWRLKKKLVKAGFEAMVTRDSDEYISLADRSRQGNGTSADVFVSIHANSSRNRAACGLETYFLSEAKTDWERAVAARENAAFEPGADSGRQVSSDLSLILADLAQNEFLWESSDLAARIQEATVPYARVHNRGVRQANFYVLRNIYMPAVLVECGFLSNRSENKLLLNSDHRERLAEGICRGVKAFCQQWEGRTNGQSRAGQRGAKLQGLKRSGR